MRYMDPAIAAEWRKARVAIDNGFILHITGRTVQNIRDNIGKGVSVYPHPDGGFIVRKRIEKIMRIQIIGNI